MKRTIAIKLETTKEQSAAFALLTQEFSKACNYVVPIARKNRCLSHTTLHHRAYYPTRATTKLGSQMVCNAIKLVANSFRVLNIKTTEDFPLLTFKPSTSVHFDKRTYSLQGEFLSLYTLSGRILVPMVVGDFQRDYLKRGRPKEAQLIYKNKAWFFNLVLDIPELEPIDKLLSCNNPLGVDLGTNVLAATSSGRLFSGNYLEHKRACALAMRSRLQCNGSRSSKQLLKKTSGQESRYVSHVNHCISKAIVKEAVDAGCDSIALETLTNIRKHIKAGKRTRSRLHKWPWKELQTFITYKAQAAGLKVIFVNPAYTSQICSECGHKGTRNKHRFVCNICGIRRHSDSNASRNIRRIAMSADVATGSVNFPHVTTV